MWFSGWAVAGSFDPKKKSYQVFSYKKNVENGLRERGINAVHCDSRGQVWFGYLSRGVSRFDPRSGIFTHFSHDPADKNSLGSNQYIWAITEDFAGNIWIGGNGGLSVWQPEAGHFIRYGTEQGLPEGQVQALVEDLDSCMWVATDRGFAKYDPRRGRFFLFDEMDGFGAYENVHPYCPIDKNGRLFFTTETDVISFHPRDIRIDTVTPKLVLKAFQLFDRPVKAGDETGLLRQELDFTTGIELEFDQNVFTIHLDVGRLAQKMFMSRTQLFRKVKALTGQPTVVFIRSIRMQRARILLETTDLQMSDIAWEVGFSDPAYFSRVFREEFGVPPSEWKGSR